MNLFNNKDIRNLLLTIFTYIAMAFIPLLLTICLILIYIKEVNGEYLNSGLIVVLVLPCIIAYTFKLLILPIISIIIYKKSYNPYIKYMFQTFKLPFILFIIFSFVDIVIFLMLNYLNFFLSHILLYLTLLSITSLYLPFYIVSFFCALKYKFFNNKIDKQNR